MSALGQLGTALVAPALGTALLAAFACWGMCRDRGSAAARLRAWTGSVEGPEDRDTLFEFTGVDFVDTAGE
jgi:hypothetical protein